MRRLDSILLVEDDKITNYLNEKLNETPRRKQRGI